VCVCVCVPFERIKKDLGKERKGKEKGHIHMDLHNRQGFALHKHADMPHQFRVSLCSRRSREEARSRFEH
jgi:hypothetical protein